jgi:hypothetical protein
MGVGSSVQHKYESVEAAIADGKTKEEVDAYLAANSPAPPKSFVPESYTSAANVLRIIHAKERTCVDVVTACFDRIDETKELNCIVEALKDASLEQAKAIDEKIAKGEPLRKLEGLPIVVKNNIHGPSGTLCAAGTPALAGHRPKTVAPVLQGFLSPVLSYSLFCMFFSSFFSRRSGGLRDGWQRLP